MSRPDINEIRMKFGDEAARAFSDNAKPYERKGNGPANEEHKGNDSSWQSPEPPVEPFQTFDARDWQGVPLEPRLFTVRDWIPAGEPGLVAGDGGVGKTRLMLQLSTGVAAEWPDWVGMLIARACARLLCRRATRADAPDRQGYPGLPRPRILRPETRAAFHYR
jgi:hypothetical protein